MLHRLLTTGQTGEGLGVQTRDLLLRCLPVFPSPAPPLPTSIGPCVRRLHLVRKVQKRTCPEPQESVVCQAGQAVRAPVEFPSRGRGACGEGEPSQEGAGCRAGSQVGRGSAWTSPPTMPTWCLRGQDCGHPNLQMGN